MENPITAQHYREEAKCARRMAALPFNANNRQTLLDIAEQYDTLARTTERGQAATSATIGQATRGPT
jgi:hypothetical protein